jgi:hypothetical protein
MALSSITERRFPHSCAPWPEDDSLVRERRSSDFVRQNEWPAQMPTQTVPDMLRSKMLLRQWPFRILLRFCDGRLLLLEENATERSV